MSILNLETAIFLQTKEKKKLFYKVWLQFANTQWQLHVGIAQCFSLLPCSSSNHSWICFKCPPWPHRKHIATIPWFFVLHTEHKEFTVVSLLLVIFITNSFPFLLDDSSLRWRLPFRTDFDFVSFDFPVTINGTSGVEGRSKGLEPVAKNCGERRKSSWSCFVAVWNEIKGFYLLINILIPNIILNNRNSNIKCNSANCN